MEQSAMSSKIDAAFGIHAQALQLYGKRAEVLAANMANADTPGYKARDIDFRAVLNGVSQGEVSLARTHGRHIDMAAQAGDAMHMHMKYRIPHQTSADGDTVDVQVEQSQFAQNAIRHQASFAFLDGTIKSLLGAIRGE
jgi:flagellar basal-body rod protein FlgB